MGQNSVYNHYKVLALSGAIDLVQDTIKVMLVSGSYDGSTTTAKRTHTTTGDIGANEVVGAGYTKGGVELTSRSLEQDNDGDEAEFHADNASWATSTITASGAVIYKSGSPAWLISYVDFGGNQTSTNGTFTINWNASEGIINLDES